MIFLIRNSHFDLYYLYSSTTQDANKIIVLDEGKIVGIGTHAELLKNCSVYQDLYNQENLKE